MYSSESTPVPFLHTYSARWSIVYKLFFAMFFLNAPIVSSILYTPLGIYLTTAACPWPRPLISCYEPQFPSFSRVPYPFHFIRDMQTLTTTLEKASHFLELKSRLAGLKYHTCKFSSDYVSLCRKHTDPIEVTCKEILLYKTSHHEHRHSR